MTRQPPTSTLFPYTTLFRSYSFNPLEANRNIIAGNFYYKKGNYRAASRRYLEASKWDPTSADALLKLGEAARDRKSTRLNSSHMSISYAVFCLKKKKQIEIL